jgi:predicted TIM-barrel fold metal-dependent hydrolase
MLGTMDKPSQEKIFDIVAQQYPAGTGFIALSMDMEHMAAGKPEMSFEYQLEELAALKKKKGEAIYPFICADPRNPNITRQVKHFISERGFAGIKLYPALGYFPFDIRLHDIYNYALENNLPITSHCSKGPVYYRGKYTADMLVHPITGKPFTGKNNSELSWNYSDPMNYHYLLDRSSLQRYMDKTAPGREAPDFSRLKICLAHFGGDKELNKYLYSGWDYYNSRPLDDNDNWFSTIRDLIGKHENLYADIAYTWENPAYNAILKVLLEDSKVTEEQKFYRRVLFGSDYFLVSMECREREFSIDLRAYLGVENFRQIAQLNPMAFLNIIPVK